MQRVLGTRLDSRTSPSQSVYCIDTRGEWRKARASTTHFQIINFQFVTCALIAEPADKANANE